MKILWFPLYPLYRSTHGIKVFHHDNGDYRLPLNDLSDMGIDLLNPVQLRCCDWNLTELKSTIGARVCFHSAVDNQISLPQGTVKLWNMRLIWLLEPWAGIIPDFILGPCHNLQINTAIENIIAMYGIVK